MANIIEIVPQCDCCQEINESHRIDAERKVISSIKRDGWAVESDVFLCPDCAEEGFKISKGQIVRMIL